MKTEKLRDTMLERKVRKMNNKEEMPLGLSFGLSMNEDAMLQFAQLPEVEKKRVVQEAKAAGSKSEMDSLISRIGGGTWK